MSKIKTGGLDQYGAEPFEQQQFGTAGVEGVKCTDLSNLTTWQSLARCHSHGVGSFICPRNAAVTNSKITVGHSLSGINVN